MNPKLFAAVPEDARFAALWLPAWQAAHELLQQRPTLRRLALLVDGPKTLNAWRADSRAASLLNDSRVRLLVVEPDSSRPMPMLQEDIPFLMEGKVGCYIDPAIRLANMQLCARVEQALLEQVRSVLSGVATRATRGWHAMANVVLNLPRMAAAPGLDAWRDAARGMPAVVVGAGPSLDTNARDLIPFRDRIFLVACDAALATLQQAGLTPDLAASTDHTEKIWHFFSALGPGMASVPVACSAQSAWPLIRHGARGLFFGIGQSGRDRLTNQIAGPFPTWDTGRCVGHAVFELACLVGADPIILIGFDLGYAGERFHARDMAAPYFHDSPPPRENILEVPGALGGRIRTEVSMLLYLREFERRFATCGRAVWDATEGGAAKAGARVVTLRAALEEACARVAPAPRPRPRKLAAAEADRARAARARSALETWRCQSPALLDEMRKTAANLRAQLAAFKDVFAFQNNFKDIFELAADAANPVAAIRLQFELEDWARSRAMQPEPPARLLEAARAYLEDTIKCAELIPELAAMALNAEDENFPNMRKAFAVSRNDGNRGKHETWRRVLGGLEGAGIEITVYDGDPDDAPNVWRGIRETRAATVVMLDGALFPASWAMPGAACFDCRTTLPGEDAFVEQWHWLPGYAMIAAERGIAEAWRKRAPAWCAVYEILAGNMLRQAGSDAAAAWPDAIAAGAAAARACLRASEKTA